MAAIMKRITGIVIALGIIFGILYSIFKTDIWLSLTITFVTTAYHFVMRLFVGFVFNQILNNKVDYNRKWFQISTVEVQFYNAIKVKKWKNRMPTYDPKQFSNQKHTWDEIAQAMCQAELVHETIAILSFLPIIMSIWWEAFGVFLITSVCAAFLDLSFVIIQRYNRPRVLRLIKRDKHMSEKEKMLHGEWHDANVSVLQGVTIGAGCVIAAGTVVTKDVPENCLVAGVPATIKKRINQ